MTITSKFGGFGPQTPKGEAMTPDQIKKARQELGLKQRELAVILDTDPHTVRRLEMTEDKATARKPAPRMVRLIQAYLDGYRPSDWPK